MTINIKKLLVDLASDHHPEPIDPKAVYITRDRKLFQQAIDAIDFLDKENTELMAKITALQDELAYYKQPICLSLHC